MSKYANKKFWTDTVDRVVATFAQSAVAALGADVTGLINIDLLEVASVAGLAALVALLTSIGFRGREEEAPPAIVLPIGGGPEAEPEFADDEQANHETVDMSDSVDDDEEPGKYGDQ